MLGEQAHYHLMLTATVEKVLYFNKTGFGATAKAFTTVARISL